MNIGLELPIKNTSLEKQTKRFDPKHGVYYKCNHCTYIFKKFSYMEKHMTTRHSSISLENYSYKRPCFKYKCEFCEVECSSLYFLNIHKRIYHIEHNLKCELCTYFTKSEINLKRHIVAVHESISKSVKFKSNDESKITQRDQLVQNIMVQPRNDTDEPQSSDDSDCDIVTCDDDSNLSSDPQTVHVDHLYALSPYSVSNKKPQGFNQHESQVLRNLNQFESQVPQNLNQLRDLNQLESQVPQQFHIFEPEVLLNCNPCEPQLPQSLNFNSQRTNEHVPQLLLSINGKTHTIPILDLRVVNNFKSNHSAVLFRESVALRKVSELTISNSTSVSLNTFDKMNTNSGRDKDISDSQTKQYSCHLCNYATDSQSNLIIHQSTHLLKTPFRCKKCKVFFENDVLLQRHAIWHRLKIKSLKVWKDKALKCRLCRLTFRNESFLERHKAWHRAMKAEQNSSKNFCTKCRVSFSSCSELKRHKPIHSVKCSIVIERLNSHNRVIKVKNELDHHDNFTTLSLISDFDPPSTNFETLPIVDQIKMETQEIVDKSLPEPNTLTVMDISLAGSITPKVEKDESHRVDKSIAGSKTSRLEKGGNQRVDKSVVVCNTSRVIDAKSQIVETSRVNQSLAERNTFRVGKAGSRRILTSILGKSLTCCDTSRVMDDGCRRVDNSQAQSYKLRVDDVDSRGLNTSEVLVSIQDNSPSKFIDISPDIFENSRDTVEYSPDIVENSPDDSVTKISPDDSVTKISPDDSVTKTSPDDTVTKTSPDDSVTKTSPDDSVTKTSPDDTVTKTSPDDTVTKTSPDDTVTKTSPDDTVTKTSPDDTVTKTSPDDTVTKTSPDDTVTKTSPDDTVTKTSPDDTVTKTSPDDSVTKTSPDDSVTKTSPDDTVTKNSPDDLVAKKIPDDLVAKNISAELTVENNPCKRALKEGVCLGTIPIDLKININPINNDEVWIEREIPRPKPVVLDTITVDERDSDSDNIQKPPDITSFRESVHNPVVYDSINSRSKKTIRKRKDSETKTSTESKKCKTGPALDSPLSSDTCREALTKLSFLQEIDVTLHHCVEKNLCSISCRKKKDFASEICRPESQTAISPTFFLPEIPSMISMSDIQLPDTELLNIVNVDELDSDSDSDSIKLYGPQSYPIENSTQLLTSIKIYNCDKCDFQSGQKFAYKKHRKLHFEKRKYVCDECGFRFKRKLRLSQHKLSHKEIDEED